MRCVVQRSRAASVSVNGQIVGRINQGLVVLCGVEEGDSEDDACWMAKRVTGLRIFADAEGKMNIDLASAGGEILAISQFTLLGDARTGKRPSFIRASNAETGKRLFESFVVELQRCGAKVTTGVFQADMQVALINDGPVTILLDSKKLF